MKFNAQKADARSVVDLYPADHSTRGSVDGSFGDPAQISDDRFLDHPPRQISERATIAMPLGHRYFEHVCEMKALRFHVLGRGEALFRTPLLSLDF